MEAIDRVFFHELGHFVAAELNSRYFNGGGTEEVVLYPCEENEEIYCGHTTPVLPAGVTAGQMVPLQRLPEHLASLMYGCFFQDYYQGYDTFKNCLDVNGKKDLRAWFGGLMFNGRSDLNKACGDIERAYYQQLVASGELDDFMKLDPTEFLVHQEGMRYVINLPKLLDTLNEAIDGHFLMYASLIDSYETILL